MAEFYRMSVVNGKIIELTILHENFSCGLSLAVDKNQNYYITYNNFDSLTPDYYQFKNIPACNENEAFSFFEQKRKTYLSNL